MALPLWLTVETLARLAVAVLVVLVWWPAYALPQYGEMDYVDRLATNAARMILFLIVVGYILTAAHLLLWVPLAVLIFLLRFSVRPAYRSRYELSANSRLAASFLAELDRLATAPGRLVHGFKGGWQRFWRQLRPPSLYGLIATIATLVVVGVSAVVRFWGNWTHAALPYSDAYVVIVWMKDILAQQLFPGGIYPRGFHLVLAELDKLSLGSPVVFEKFFGPAVGLAMVLAVGYSAWRLTGRVAPGIVAMLLYGTMFFLFPYVADRQAATDSQEFGNVFALPVAYFVYQSWVDPRQRGWRWTAVCLLAITGLVHPIPLLNATIAAVAGTVAGWMAAGIDREALGWYLKWVPLTALLVVLPVAVPHLLGIPLYASSAGFLTAHTNLPAPKISRVAEVAAAGCVLLFLLRLIRRQEGAQIGAPLVALFSLAGAVAVQQLPRFGINSALLTTRSGEFVAFCEALGLAMAWCLIEEVVGWVVREKAAAWLSLISAMALSAFAWMAYPPPALTPYSMTSDAYVAAYEQIATTQPAGTWLAISNNFGYSLALGQGFQIDVPVFVSHVSPTAPYRWPHYAPGGGVRPYPLAQSEIFFFVNHHYHLAPAAVAGALYAAIDRHDTALITAWLAKWDATHSPPTVFFSSPELTVYELSLHPTAAAAGRLAPSGG